MKEFLIDVPVKVNIWIRSDCQRKQFEVIREARPSILFVTSDGGRNEKEWEAIYQNRKLYDEGIDWNCKVYKLYMDKNIGMYGMMQKRAELIWQTVDRCIMLEDDQIPAVSYFRFCAELLEKYKDDQRIECICGVNHLGISENVTTDYFFSHQGSIWGTATWKRVVEERGNCDFANDPYIMNLLRERACMDPPFWKCITEYLETGKYEGHVPGSEFWIELHVLSQNRLQIIPKKNLISNIGADDNAAHAINLKMMSPWKRGIFNMKTHELDFPLKHAKYVIPDIEYEKKRNRIMGTNAKFTRVRRLLFLLTHGKIQYIVKKLISTVFENKHDEK